MLTSQEPAELSAQLNSTDSVMAKKAAGLPSLDASQVLLRVKKQAVREAKAAVALRRKAAAENLTRREGLTARAEQAATQERGLVRERAAARARAVRPEPRTGDSSASFVPSRSGSRPCSASGQLSGRGGRPRQPATARLEGSTRPPLTNSPGLLSNPVDSYITSLRDADSPVYKRWNLHDGTDFGAACGTPIPRSLPPPGSGRRAC